MAFWLGSPKYKSVYNTLFIYLRNILLIISLLFINSSAFDNWVKYNSSVDLRGIIINGYTYAKRNKIYIKIISKLYEAILFLFSQLKNIIKI